MTAVKTPTALHIT